MTRQGRAGEQQDSDMLRIVLGSLAFALFCIGSISFATEHKVRDEMLLFEEIPSVFGASRFEQKITEAPSSVTVVTVQEIKMYGYRTLAEILQSVRGFSITNDRNYTYLGARGFGRPGDYNARVLVLVDGHRINDSVYDGASIGSGFPVDVDLIERVEVIRGPGSSLYGGNALFAVINVITRRGRDIRGAEVSGSAGSFDTYTGSATYGDKFRNGLDLVASGSYLDSGGQSFFFKEFNSPLTNYGLSQNNDSDKATKFFSTLSYKDFTLQGVFSSRDKHIPTASYDTIFNDHATKTIDEQAYVELKYERSLENQFGLLARTFYDHYSYSGIYPYDRSEEGSPLLRVLNKDVARAESLGGEMQVSKKLFEKHKIILGSEYHGNLRQDQFNYDVQPYNKYLTSQKSSFNWGIYLQDEFQISRNFILNAGVRYDDFETTGGVVDPRLALIYRPFEKTAIKAIYGTALRPPNNYELYYEDGTTMKASRHLDPEKINTYELLWEQYIGKYFWMTMGGFYYKIDDLINLETDTDGMLVYKNLENVTAKGFEFELNGKWPNGIQGRLSYVLQRAEDDFGHKLTNSATHEAKLNFIVPVIRERLFLGTQFIYMSPRGTLAGKEVDDAYITNLTLYAPKVWRGLDISGGIYNIFDQRFYDPASAELRQDALRQDGIAFRVKATYSF